MMSFLRARRGGTHAPRRVTQVRPARDVVAAEAEGVAVLLDLRRDIYFSLDEVGTVIWRELERTGSAADALDRVTEEFDAPPTAADDVGRFIDELVARRLVVAS